MGHAAAVSPEDAERLARLGVDPVRIQVLGDPRADSALRRIGEVDAKDPLLRLGDGAPTLVAGSTWPADEDVLLDAFTRVRARHPAARLILVPHEPTRSHLASVDERARRARLPEPIRLSAATAPAALLLVDRVGALATLYGAGGMAYVGGGFGRAGLHSVLEPAAWGRPVAFGPRWSESRDAALLRERGGGVAVGEGGAPGGEDLARRWLGWIDNEAERAAQGARAKAVVEAGRGASRRSAAMLADAISSRPPRTSPTAGR